MNFEPWYNDNDGDATLECQMKLFTKFSYNTPCKFVTAASSLAQW